MKTVWEYGLITVSMMIMTIGVYFFKFPNHFAFGGVTGFSTVVSELTRWSASQFTFIANMVLLVLGFLNSINSSVALPGAGNTTKAQPA